MPFFFTVLSNSFVFVSIGIELMKFCQLLNIKSGLYPCLARLFIQIRRLNVLKCLNEQIPTLCLTTPPLNLFFEEWLNIIYRI